MSNLLTVSNEYIRIFFEVIKLSLETADLKTFIDKVLDYLLEIEGINVEKKAGFMIYHEGELRLISYKNVSDSLVKMCGRVAIGQCLCGKAAELREVLYKAHIDDDHENRPEGMLPHGHYNVPIVQNEQLLGVLFLYIKDGEEKNEQLIEFLKQLASILSMVILKYQFESEYQYSIVKLIRTNELMIENLKKIQTLEELVKTYVPQTILKYQNQDKRKKKISFDIEENYYLLLNINGILPFSEVFPIQKIYETIQSYYAPVIDVILEHGGDIEQFIEDKILAIYKDSYNVLLSALKIKEIIFSVNQKRQEMFLKPFTFQISIKYGKTFFGIIGSEKRKNWMRYGQTIRLLNLMQRKCKYNQIIVSEEVYKEQKDKFLFSESTQINLENGSHIVAYYLVR
ncbi:MAG: GAF domain-containing protein [Leptospiraceae bacterium]|nr:GAF domain-containing protein [Leptospiraceae bacterium]